MFSLVFCIEKISESFETASCVENPRPSIPNAPRQYGPINTPAIKYAVTDGNFNGLNALVMSSPARSAIDTDNSVAFYLIHDDIYSNLASGSGFEQTVASLALRSVLSKISTFSKPSFVVFDEVLGGVAEENYDKVRG